MHFLSHSTRTGYNVVVCRLPVISLVSTYLTKHCFLDTFSDLRTTRARLLEMFTDITCNPDIMKNVTDAYFSLLQGIITLLVIHSPFFYCLCGLDVLNYFCMKAKIKTWIYSLLENSSPCNQHCFNKVLEEDSREYTPYERNSNLLVCFYTYNMKISCTTYTVYYF